MAWVDLATATHSNGKAYSHDVQLYNTTGATQEELRIKWVKE
jgi:hypothetical protein